MKFSNNNNKTQQSFSSYDNRKINNNIYDKNINIIDQDNNINQEQDICPNIDNKFDNKTNLTSLEKKELNLLRYNSLSPEEQEKINKKKEKKIEKMNKKKILTQLNHSKLLSTLATSSVNIHSSVPSLNQYNVKKKLLVFDFNKVLVSRRKGKQQYVIRPNLFNFLLECNKNFHISIWSSMKKKNIKLFCNDFLLQSNNKIKKLNEINQTNYSDISFYFQFYQHDCDPLIPPQIQELIQKYEETGEYNRQIDNYKPIFLKNLSKVYYRFPQFNETNTILIDDSLEKSINNPLYNLIQPVPFDLSEIEQAEYEGKDQAYVESKNLDRELAEDSKLSNYLRELAKFDGTVEEFTKIHGLYRKGL